MTYHTHSAFFLEKPRAVPGASAVAKYTSAHNLWGLSDNRLSL